MGSDADGFIKASSQMNEAWLAGLVEANVIDQASSDRLRSKRYSLLAIRAEDLKIPDAWIKEDVDIAERMVSAFRQHIRGGLTAEDLGALTRTLTALYAFVDAGLIMDTSQRTLRTKKPFRENFAIASR